MRFNGHNLLAILVAAIAIYLIEFVIFAVLIPAELYMAYTGITETQVSANQWRMPIGMIMPLLAAVGLSLVIKWRNAPGFMGGVTTALWMALLFAGSAVAYCIGITNIDPIKYKLLFERFLNPDRKSMPDIDTDFDDEGRQKVIDYVVEKYGREQVAQIVTYGTMAAKMSIKDVARVLDLPLDRANTLAKLVPEKPGISLNRVIKAPLDGEGSLKEKETLNSDDIENCKKLREIREGDTLEGKVLKEALMLEGSVRNTGIHAAGIIIAPKPLSEIIPVYASKDTELLITQFEGSTIEDAGVIKMDFLGLACAAVDLPLPMPPVRPATQGAEGVFIPGRCPGTRGSVTFPTTGQCNPATAK